MKIILCLIVQKIKNFMRYAMIIRPQVTGVSKACFSGTYFFLFDFIDGASSIPENIFKFLFLLLAINLFNIFFSYLERKVHFKKFFDLFFLILAIFITYDFAILLRNLFIVFRCACGCVSQILVVGICFFNIFILYFVGFCLFILSFFLISKDFFDFCFSWLLKFQNSAITNLSTSIIIIAQFSQVIKIIVKRYLKK